MKHPSLRATPRECLLRVLLGDHENARQSACALSSSGAWPAALEAAKKWNVTSQLADAIEGLPCELPQPQWHDFRRAQIAAYARSASRAARGAAALRRLQSCGVPALAFKGLASMARLYPAPGKRTVKDADFLIERQHLEKALASLSEMGFTPLEQHKPDRLDRFLDHSPGFSGNKAIVVYGPEDCEFDVHWSVGIRGLEPADLLRRSETVMLFGSSIRIVRPEDGMILTARHAIRENLAVDTICRDLFDIRLSCAWLASNGRLAGGCQDAARCGSILPALILTKILAELDGGQRAVSDASTILAGLATPQERRAAARLRDLFFYQVREGPVSKDLLYLAHSRPARQILRGASANWREYRAMMRSLEEKLEGMEIPLLRRLGLLASAIYKTGPGHFCSLRALARAKYAE